MSGIALSAGFASFGPLNRLGQDSLGFKGQPSGPIGGQSGGHSGQGRGNAAARRAGSLARSRQPQAAGREMDMSLADSSDEDLMSAHLAGDRRAFVALVERYRAELHQFLARFLGSSAAADDVFQETFLQVHLAGHSFDRERAFKPWLFTIAANKARDWHRRQKRRSTISLDAPVGGCGDAESARLIDLIQLQADAPSAPSESTELRQQVSGVINALPTHYREILLLSYFQRMSYNQVAEVLGIPLGTVKSRLHAAVAAFADRWMATKENRP